jgi:UDP:flavonoid glycosyltransferase YjiC (YdhE family)
MPSHRIVLATFGSLGDLHPYLALAQELKRRGHHPVVATLAIYRDKVESAGFEFRLLRTAHVEHPDGELMQKALDPRDGAEFIVRKLVMPLLTIAYRDALSAFEGAALVVVHQLTLAARLAAESMQIPWVFTQLAPMGFLSAYDPPVLPILPSLTGLRLLGPAFFRPLLSLAKRSTRSWTRSYHDLRSELGLPASGNPLFEGAYSPDLVLALFSRTLGERQPDWPPRTIITGFPFYDGEDAALTPELESFLRRGDPPIVFTLGSSAVLDAGRFYQDSADAARLLGRRAVLLVGSEKANIPAGLPASILAINYAPYSLLFPRCGAIVHQGGVGTTGQAMRSGRPMLVMPYALDQPDNAERVRRLGIARVISRKQYSSSAAARELKILLETDQYRQRSESVSRSVASENGAETAGDHLERLLSKSV